MRNHRWTGLLVFAMVVTMATPALAGTGLFFRGSLTDLQSSTDPTDGAIAGARASVARGTTTVELVVRGIDRASAGATFGAHVHIGSCIEGDGSAAFGHYNTGGPASPATEVWLDFAVSRGGTGHAKATVPFEIPPGAAGSIVIHALATAPDGGAGTRLACLPLAF
jgi:hypothetical protein